MNTFGPCQSAARRLSLNAAIAGLVLTIAGGSAARSEIISAESMLQGTSSTPARCSALQEAVWVTAFGQGYCMRYYISTAGGEGDRPVVHFSGDKLGAIDKRTGDFKTPDEAKDVDTDHLFRLAERLSKQARTAAIYLARMGIDGSSGYHGQRRTVLELAVTNAALDAIKRRHGFAGFHLVGQSGGAGLVGGLIGKRNDIGCAVPGSGRLALLKRQRPEGGPDRTYFDASENIPQVIRNGARILIVTDPDDQRVKEANQSSFFEDVERAGGKIEQYYVQATDELHHGVKAYAHYAAAKCIQGAGSAEIAQGLADMSDRRVAQANERRRAGAATFPATAGPAPTQAAPSAGPYPPQAPAAYPSPWQRDNARFGSQAPATMRDRRAWGSENASPSRYAQRASEDGRGYEASAAQSAPTIPYPYANGHASDRRR